jgi:hypothetical protein
LCRCHDHRNDVVFCRLVGAQVELGLDLLLRIGLEPGFDGRAIGNHFAVEVDGPGCVDVDLQHFRLDERRRWIARREIEIDRVQLDGNRDDEHHEQHEHHVDERRRVDVHDRIVLTAPRTHIHCHDIVPRFPG